MVGHIASFAASLFVIATAIIVVANVTTLLVAIWRGVRDRMRPVPAGDATPVSIIRPLCGLEQFSQQTLESSFRLDHPEYEIIFCVATAEDPVIPLVREVMARHPNVPARLLIGDIKASMNPKLNNCIAGWSHARHELVILADSNVLMPPDYIDRMTRLLGPNVGLVSAPPIGSHPFTTAAEWEMAFLNSFQARWQMGADAFGFGFAQGKNMLFRKSIVDRHGGIAALGDEPAEDAAATKLLHKAGWRVAVVARPFEQPLGARSWRDVWSRQVRWAKLRRATFPGLFALEIISGSLAPAILVAVSAALLGHNAYLAFGVTALALYGLEFVTGYAQAWRQKWSLPAFYVLRDIALPAIWLNGWIGRSFEWHGHVMSANATQQR